MSRVRQVVAFDRDWLSKVEPGKPFTLVDSKTVLPTLSKMTHHQKKTQFSVRTLRNLGELLTIEEAAKMMKVTTRSVYEWVGAKRLRSLRAGRSIRISISDLEEFMNA